MIVIPDPVGESPRPRIVHDAMWMAYVYHGCSASETAAQLNRELKTRETKGSVVSYAHRQLWGKAQINALPLQPTGDAPALAPRVYAPKITKAPLSDLPILPPERKPAKKPNVPAAFIAPMPKKREPEGVDLSLFIERPAPVFGPVRPIDLCPQHCKWPLGDPGNDAFRHCGERRTPGEPYCGAHMRKAYPNGTPKERANAAQNRRHRG